MKKFNEFVNESAVELTEKQIKFLDEHAKDRWTLNDEGFIDIEGHFKCDHTDIVSFPVKFGTINGAFDCSYCKNLASLEGAPHTVKLSFCCGKCKSLTSLEGIPQNIEGDLIISFCKNLLSLKNSPIKIGKHFYCHYNDKLTSLKYASETPNGHMYCHGCKALNVKEQTIVNDEKLMEVWRDSKMDITEFMEKCYGAIALSDWNI